MARVSQIAFVEFRYSPVIATKETAVASRSKPHSQTAQRTKLLGVRLMPGEHEAFQDLACGEDADMSTLAYGALAEKWPHLFCYGREGAR